MNKKDKLLRRFYASPRDFTFDELTALFSLCGFELRNKGVTSGSRVEFVNKVRGLTYIAHKPHPSPIVKGYVMRQVKRFLLDNGLINPDEL